MESQNRSPSTSESGKSSSGTVREGIDKAKAKASETLEQAEREGKNRVSTQKDRAAERAGKLSDALGQASQRLRDEGELSLARYTEQIASSINGLAEKFRQRSVDDLLRDMRDTARREPALFLAGSVALGFAISRFFKASSTPEHDHYEEDWRASASSASEKRPADPEFGAAPEATHRAEAVTTTGTIPQQDRSFSPGSSSGAAELKKEGA